MKRIIRLGLCLSALTAAGVLAQDIDETEAAQEELRRYSVEVIVFRYAQDVSSGSEIFAPDALPPEPESEPESELELELEQTAETGLEQPAEPAPELPHSRDDVLPGATSDPMAESGDAELEAIPQADIVPFADDQFALTEIFDKLSMLDVYEPLLHAGWTQAAIPRENAEAVDLLRLGEPVPGLAGQFTLYLSRYLHLVVELALDAEIPADDEAAAEDLTEAAEEMLPVYGDYRTLQDDYYADEELSDEPETGPLRFRINEDRIFRNGDLRYFDHPRFGVLVNIVRVEAEADEALEEAAENGAVNELLGYPGE